MKARWDSLWLPAAVSAVALALLGVFTLDRSPPIWDSVVYFHMASPGGLLSGGTAPFCFRILAPALAKAIPLPLPAAFELMNQVSIWCAAMLIYHLLRRRGFSPGIALVGPCLAILSAFTKFVVWYRFGIDQLALLGVAAVTWAIVEKRFRTAALLASVAVIAKESVLLLAPFLYGELPFTRDRPHPRIHRLVSTIVLWAAPVAVFIALRLRIRSTDGSGMIDTIWQWASIRLQSPKAAVEMLLALPKTFGAVSLVILSEYRSVWPMIRKEPHVFVTILAFIDAGIFGASDYERVYFLSLPLVLIVFLRLLVSMRPRPWKIAVFVAAQASLLDVFAKSDFMDLPRWFMVNTQWPDLALYGAKVTLWWGALYLASAVDLREGRAS
jgi:hypothetical protein